MKYLLLLPLFLSGCYNDDTPLFKVGDCITTNRIRESWEKPGSTYKILTIGKEKYLMKYVTPERMKDTFTDTYISFQDIYKIVDCPKE